MSHKSAREYYRSYIADNEISWLNAWLIELILADNPNHVFEFGCGTGKHLQELQAHGIDAMGLDISFANISIAYLKNDVCCVMIGSDDHLRHLCNFDTVFTCSVIDHLPDAVFIPVINELKRIANKHVYLAETNDVVGEYYYAHDYEGEGFVRTGKSFKSSDDGALYEIWKWSRDE